MYWKGWHMHAMIDEYMMVEVNAEISRKNIGQIIFAYGGCPPEVVPWMRSGML